MTDRITDHGEQSHTRSRGDEPGSEESEKKGIVPFSRRTLLTSISAAGIGATGSTAAARPGSNRGFPPEKHTIWGGTKSLGEGTVQTFVTENPAGKPMFVGMEISRAAATLDEEVYDEPELVAIDFPGETEFEWLGLNWMPEGHGPPEVYGVPHFDIHYYLDSREEIEEIPGVYFPPYDPPDEDEPYDVPIATDQLPPDYFRTNYVVPEMGEHLFNATAPEWDGPGVPSDKAFANTFVWGHWERQLNFFEPMITTAFFRDLETDVAHDISMPARMPTDGDYPTWYKVAYHGNKDTYTVTLESFESFAKSEMAK